MKKYLLILLTCILSVASLSAQVLIVDSLFGVEGIFNKSAGNGDVMMKIISQPDSMIILCGHDYDINANDFHNNMIRIDECGHLDYSFGDSGIVHHKFSQRNLGYGYALQPDGKIVCVGIQAPSNFGSQQVPFVARYNIDGSVDTTFAVQGTNEIRFDPISSGSFYSVYIMPDGRILCIGRSSGNINGGVTGVGAMRFLSNGSLDNTFDGDGITRLTSSIHAVVTGQLLQNGDIVTLAGGYDGSFNLHFFAAAFDSTGAVNTAFAAGGIYMDSVNLTAPVASGKQDDKILIASLRQPSTDGIEVVRLLPNGTLDNTFGNSGHVNFNYTGINTCENITVIDSNIYVYGGYSLGFGVGFIVRLDYNGSVDSTFGSNGFLFGDLNGNTGTHSVKDMFKMWNGQLLIAGSDANFLVARLLEQSNVPHITQYINQLTTTGSGLYQWYRNDTLIPGATADIYTVTQAGSYTVLLTDTFGCTYMSGPLVILNSAISDLKADDLSIYPNPVADVLMIEYMLKEVGNVEFRITDMAGRIVSQQITFIETPGVQTESMKMVAFPKGSYILEVITKDQTLATRIVKI